MYTTKAFQHYKQQFALSQSSPFFMSICLGDDVFPDKIRFN